MMRRTHSLAAFDALYPAASSSGVPAVPSGSPGAPTFPSVPRIVRDAHQWSAALDSVRVSPTSPYFVPLAMSAYEARRGGAATLEALADAYDLALAGGVPGDLPLEALRGVVAESVHSHFADLCASDADAAAYTWGQSNQKTGVEGPFMADISPLGAIDLPAVGGGFYGGPLLGFNRLDFLDTVIPASRSVTPSDVLRQDRIPRWCPYCGAWVEQRAGSDACPWCSRGDLAAAPWIQEAGAAMDHACLSTLDLILFDAPSTTSWELLGDSADGLMRVRQLAMECDAWNLNNRLYPRDVVIEMLQGGMARARAGAMLSEFRHPKVARVDGQDRYVDNPDDKTARVDEIEMPDAQGRVYITRTILDTPQGRRVAERIRQKNPFGISTRFLMRGREGVNPATGRPGTIATRMVLSTWDDVESPGVAGAGAIG